MNSMFNSMFNFMRTCLIVFQSSYTIFFPMNNLWGFQFLCIFASTYSYLSFLLISNPSEFEEVSHCGFDLNFSNEECF